MTTAKPGPMAGQPDESDDLIAELAKLMAQDAQGDRPAPAPAATPLAPKPPAAPVAAQPAAPTPTPPQPAPFQVRIPGGDAPSIPPQPVPHFEYDRPAASQPAAPATPRQEPGFAPARAAEPAKPAPQPPVGFDVDLGLDKRGPSEPVPPRSFARTGGQRVEPQMAASSPQPRPIPVEPRPAPVAATPPTPAAPPQPEIHDSIADLIAAELFNDTIHAEAQPAAPQVEQPKPAPQFERPVTNVPPAPTSEPDRFNVPPVFGLGSPAARPTPPPAAQSSVAPIPSATPPAPVRAAEPFVPPARVEPTAASLAEDTLGTDPIDEIENLIGRAGQVERVTPPPVAERPAPSPALRSLATPTIPAAPQPRPASGAPRQLSGADEAVFAAAAASGAKVGWVESPDFEEEANAAYAGKPQRAPRSFRLTRSVAGPLVAVTLLLAAGIGLYWVLGMSGPSGPAPLLTADATPVKETPAVDPDAAAPSQSVVFNEIDGVQPGADEQLVSRDQADVNEVTQAATPAPAPTTGEEGLANRKVRTVTVRPDGSIVSSDDAVAGSAMLPVDRPNVPAVPGAQTASTALTTASATPTTITPPATPTPVTPAVTPVQAGATVPAFDTAGNALAGRTTVIPLAKPTSFRPQPTGNSPTAPVNAIITPPATQTPIATPATPAPEAASATLSNAPAYVQLASQRTEEEARRSANNIVSRFGPLFKGANLEVQRVELGDRGIYYRVRVPADSMQSANDLCNQIKGAGGDCFAM